MVGLLVFLAVVGALALSERQRCGGRGCINQHPATSSPAVHR